MRKRLRFTAAGCGLAVVFLLAACALAWAADVFRITESRTALRSTKFSMGPKVLDLVEGDQVAVLAVEESWVQAEPVNNPGVQGWIKQSSITPDKDYIPSADAVARGVTPTQAAAAGRGFNPEVERQYRQDNPDLEKAFKFLDEVVKARYSEGLITAFMKTGNLLDGTGGGK